MVPARIAVAFFGKVDVTFSVSKRTLAQVDSSGTVSYLVTDTHGSVRMSLDGSGHSTGVTNYDAYGNFIGSSNVSIYTYAGDSVYDANSGLYFHGSGRQSSPKWRRFIIRDPRGYGRNITPLSLNLYVIYLSNPIHGSDPTGHDDTEAEALVTASLGTTLISLGVAVYDVSLGSAEGDVLDEVVAGYEEQVEGYIEDANLESEGVSIPTEGGEDGASGIAEKFDNPAAAIGDLNGEAELVGKGTTSNQYWVDREFTETEYYVDSNGDKWTVFKNPTTGEYSGAHLSSGQ